MKAATLLKCRRFHLRGGSPRLAFAIAKALARQAFSCEPKAKQAESRKIQKNQRFLAFLDSSVRKVTRAY
ncbi:MAG: hypothetical protein QM537_07965, partial [Candidatus Symbiobacter sp.]|nr:hypothetical protein [Candidatus Symbiobacter sp.]